MIIRKMQPRVLLSAVVAAADVVAVAVGPIIGFQTIRNRQQPSRTVNIVLTRESIDITSRCQQYQEPRVLDQMDGALNLM